MNLEIIWEILLNIAIGIFSAWLYDKLKHTKKELKKFRKMHKHEKKP